MLPHPEDLDAEEQLQLKQVLAACPHLDATATHVATFAEMLTGRHGERLDSWMTAIDAADLPHLQRFVTGLRRDYQAVRRTGRTRRMRRMSLSMPNDVFPLCNSPL